MAESDEKTTVTRNDAARRYEIHVGSELAGFTQIRVGDGGHVLFPHSEILPAFGGRGLGSILAAEALADVARRGEIAVPACPFISRYVREHDVPGLIVEWPHPITADND